MQKPPVGFRGDTGIGALTGLSGVGQQDPFLYDFDSKREYNYNEYSQATSFYRFYRPTSTTFLGEEIRYTFRPQDMGDLLTGLMLKFNFPTTTGTPTCLKNLGLSLIKKVDLVVNGKTIQTLRGEWLSIYESMYSSEQDRENILNVSFNLGAKYNTQPVLKANDTSQRLFFPIPFFFNNHYVDSKADTKSFRAPLPLCAMHNSEITLVIQFFPLDNLVSDTSGFAIGADLTDFMFVTEEVTLTPSERFMLRSTRHEYPIEKVTAEDVQIPGSVVGTFYRYFFNSAYSCRAIFWTFKNAIAGYNPDSFNPLIDARITTLNKTDRNELRKPLFLQELQAYLHDYYNDRSFYGYSFSEQPLQVVVGDYEFRAPRPQSSSIEMFFTAVTPGYSTWSVNFSDTIQNYVINNNNKILLDTSVGLGGGTKVLNSLDMTNFGYLMTDTARVGIPATSYTDTTNLSNPFMMRFEPWNGSNEGYIKITRNSRVNINTKVIIPSQFILTTYYLSTNTLVVENGSADVIDYDITNGAVEGKFNNLDVDASGFIEAIEFDVSTYDKDGDNKISFAEFKEIEEV